MNNQNLIIYEFDELYKILLEIKKNINLNLKKANKVNILELNLQSNCLIFTKKKIPEIDNQIIYDKFPISIQKLLEKINTEFLKKNFIEKSDIIIGIYKLNLNSREMFFNDVKLKLTEKEINSIIYLSKSTKAIKILEFIYHIFNLSSIIKII